MDQVQDLLLKTFSFQAGSWNIEPTYWQAAAIVFLLFLLVLTLARLRHMYVHWSLKGASGMIALGFFLALILEGFLIIGGKTVLTELLGWENPPKPVRVALDEGRAKLVDVLGAQDEIPVSIASENPTRESVLSDFQTLSEEDAANLRELLCEPTAE